MQDEYDFSKGERGKFYHADAKMNLPIYLEEEVLVFVEKIASKKRQNLSMVVNQLLRNDMQLANIISQWVLRKKKKENRKKKKENGQALS